MPRVLIIEDSKGIAKALGIVLKSAGYDVETEPNGALGLERLRTGSFDVALLDVWMPEMDGLQVLTRARQSGIDTRFVMMSGGGPDIPIEFTQAVSSAKGAVTFLVKPFENDRLLAAVRQALASGPADPIAPAEPTPAPH